MLTAKEIEQLVKSNSPLPKYADCYEKFYYHALSIGVELFRQKKISRDKLRDYCKEYRNIYEEVLLWNRIMDKNGNRRELDMSRLCDNGWHLPLWDVWNKYFERYGLFELSVPMCDDIFRIKPFKKLRLSNRGPHN